MIDITTISTSPLPENLMNVKSMNDQLNRENTALANIVLVSVFLAVYLSTIAAIYINDAKKEKQRLSSQ
jgi:hypothetical protein